MTLSAAKEIDERAAAGIVLGLLAYFLFATTDALVKLLSSRYSIFQIILMESFFAALPVAAVLIRERQVPPIQHRWLVGLRALSAGAGTVSGFVAISLMPLADFYAIAFGAPLLVTVLSIPVLGERVGIHRWSAVIVGFVGIVIMIRPGFVVLGPGHLWALGSLVTIALTALIMRRLGREESPVVMVSAVLVGIFLISLPGAILAFRPPTLADVAVIGIAGLIMGIGQFAIIRAYAYAPAAVVAPTQYSMMISGVIYGALLFADAADTVVLVGATLVGAAGIYTMHRERRAARAMPTLS